MTTMVGMRELARNSNILDGYDYVEVEDKKTHEYKGLFISPKYASEFKAFLEDKIDKEQQKILDEFKPFIGTMECEDRYKGLEGKDLMREVAKAKCGSAKENRCKYLITNDKKFYDCGLSIFTTEEFLKDKNVQK